MKLSLFFLVGIFGVSTLQHGCGNTNNVNQSSTNNQNSVLTSASPTQPLPTATFSPNQNNSENGAPYEVARITTEHMERCKHAPVGSAKADPVKGVAPLKITFDGSASFDPDGTKIVKWLWHFGNGQSAEGREVTHVYEKPGKYGIALDVTDAQRQKTSDCGPGTTAITIIVTDGKNEN